MMTNQTVQNETKNMRFILQKFQKVDW